MNKNELYILYGRNTISKHKHWFNITHGHLATMRSILIGQKIRQSGV